MGEVSVEETLLTTQRPTISQILCTYCRPQVLNTNGKQRIVVTAFDDRREFKRSPYLHGRSPVDLEGPRQAGVGNEINDRAAPSQVQPGRKNDLILRAGLAEQLKLGESVVAA